MKFIHTADIHASKARKNQTLKTIEIIHRTADKESVDAIFIAGDFWDFTITATESSGFSEILRSMDELQKDFNIYMIYGTPSHEPDGSLECFAVMRNVTVIDKPTVTAIHPGIQLVAIPEPRLGKTEGRNVEEKYRTVQEMYASTFQTAKDFPADKRVLMYHGEVEGSVMQNGQKVLPTGTSMPLDLLRNMDFDYGCLGHIHNPQQVPGTNCWYPGTPCPKDFGETHEGIIKVVEI